VAFSILLIEVCLVRVGLTAAREPWIVRLHQLLEPFSNERRAILPVRVVTYLPYVGWQRCHQPPHSLSERRIFNDAAEFIGHVGIEREEIGGRDHGALALCHEFLP